VPDVSIVVSTPGFPVGGAQAVYMTARAEEVREEVSIDALRSFVPASLRCRAMLPRSFETQRCSAGIGRASPSTWY
jgi:hypothetical protein